MIDAWDELSTLFTGETSENGIPEGAADNILLAWPPVLQTIQNAIGRSHNLDVLDFGCGTGDFCRKIHSLGNRVTGSDSSRKMLQAASGTAKEVTFLMPEELFLGQNSFDIITAIMVFQFVEDIEETLSRLLTMLRPGGALVFAVFNPPFVSNLILQGMIFHGFDSPAQPVKGVMELQKGVEVQVFVRTADQYAELLGRMHCKEISRIRPPFTEVFLRRYPVPFSVRDPEFLIMGFIREN